MNISKHLLTKWHYTLLTAALAVSVGLVGWGLSGPAASAAPVVTVYKSPRCGCCGKWVNHLRKNGFEVVVKNRDDMNAVKRRLHIPGSLRSCHTATIGDYVIEGHVPAKSIRRMLDEKMPIRGLAVPRMPMGSPGMEGPNPVGYAVLQFDQDGTATILEKMQGKSYPD